jgi:transketolase
MNAPLINQVHSRSLVRWARQHPEAVVLSADLTTSTEARDFARAFPDRFYSMGLTEQTMMSWAGGMAREGFIPLVHTFAVFMYRRALDQIAISIAYPNLPVRLFGFLPGLTTPGGVTHQAIDDLNVMRGLPNLTILETGDATEVESVLQTCEAIPGPVYIRMLRGEMPRLFPVTEPMRLGQARCLRREGALTLLTSGICTEEGIKATALLASRGIPVRHLHVSTLKPFQDPTVLEALRAGTDGVITMENHSRVGGLGSAVAELMAEHAIPHRLVRLGLPDTFLHGASRAFLQQETGLNAVALLDVMRQRFHLPSDFTPDEITSHSALPGTEAEAL